MRLLHSLKSTQWVMWSSPILLLVLVFTLSASTGSPPVHAVAPALVTTSSTTSDLTTTTHVSAPPSTTTTAGAVTTTTSAPAAREASTPTTTVMTSGRNGANSSSATASNVGFVANAPAESASSGALRGAITPAEGLAVIPLAGPATWNLNASASVSLTLQCGDATVAVASPFVVGAGDECQLTLAPNNPSRTVTWELTPST